MSTEQRTGPSENEIFAASLGFGEAGSREYPGSQVFQAPVASPISGVFAGVDPFAANGPLPLFQTAPGAPIQLSDSTQASCLDVQKSLPFFLDGELTAIHQQAVTNHLDLCPSCQRAHLFQSQLRNVVAEKAIDPMPEDARARITRALGFD